jgi:deoxyribose-phosphate aldolase
MEKNTLHSYIEHTLLKPEATEEAINKLCDEAIEFRFHGVCVEGRWIGHVSQKLSGQATKIVTVVGFPTGLESTQEKARQTADAREKGAHEIDMVLNRALLKSKDYQRVWEDIHQVVLAAEKLPVKVILEMCELTQSEKQIAAALSVAAGAKFVKTSTGFSTGGATAADVQLLREIVGPEVGVKASGGIRNQEQAIAMVEAGASRLGTSASVSIVQGTDLGTSQKY